MLSVWLLAQPLEKIVWVSKQKLQEALDGVAVAVITGGSSGIGEAFIDQLMKLRPKIMICNLSRRPPAGKFRRDRVYHIRCDLSDSNDAFKGANDALNFCVSQGVGRMLLINNSGFAIYGTFTDSDVRETLEMIEVNVKAPMILTSTLMPQLVKRGGAILNIASTAAFQPTPFLGAYGASKSFLLNWSMSLQAELRDGNVEALAVCPGPTATSFFTRAGFSKTMVSRLHGQTPEQVVNTALLALRRRKSFVVCGFINCVASTIASYIPRSLATRLSGILLRRYRQKALEDAREARDPKEKDPKKGNAS